MRITVYFKDGTKIEYDGYDNSYKQTEGWLTVWDRYKKSHMYRSDTIKEVVAIHGLGGKVW